MKRSKDIFIGMVLLAMVAWCGAFAGEGAEPEKKTPDTYFVSPHVDPNMEFDVQEVEIKGVKLMIPVLKGCTLESSLSGTDNNEFRLITIKSEEAIVLVLQFHTSNIVKDDGTFYTTFKKIVYERFVDGRLKSDNAHILKIRGIACEASDESVFESNYSNAFLFWNKLYVKIDGKRSIVTVSRIAIYINGYVFTIIGVDFDDNNNSQALVTSWLDRFLLFNK